MGDALADRFMAVPRLFPTSPLYGRLGPVVAADERLLAIAGHARAGQLPENLLFAAVHYLLLGELDELGEAGHALAAWYPSLGGGSDRDPGPAFTDFCLTHRAEIVELLRHRLVQSNIVKRSAALRVGMAAVAELTTEPVTFIEVGCSAGVHLRFDAYRYEMAGRTWGTASSPVVVRAEWRDDTPPPDLDRLPAIADRVGVDLDPIDVTDPDERRWLRALIWPENTAQLALQDAALTVVAEDPPRMVTGDVVDVLPGLPELTGGNDHPVVVFHSATLLHVPAERREAFTKAIQDIARGHDLFHLSYEAFTGRGEPVFALDLRRGHEDPVRLAVGDGHGEWLRGSKRTPRRPYRRPAAGSSPTRGSWPR